MHIRDRIKEFRRVKASELRPNPRNWRTHPAAQRDALAGLLAEVGYASALVARELPDGTLELIDGHLRAETTPDALVPVLVLDVSEAEAAKLLVTLDPLAAMAGANHDLLDEILANVTTRNDAVKTMLGSLASESRAALANLALSAPFGAAPEPELPDSFQVVVQCQSESEQRDVYERLTTEGFTCRVLTL